MANLPLEGYRVLDLTMYWAGPMACRMLADMGAEVIKVESIQRIDGWRGGFLQNSGERIWEISPAHNGINPNKYGITLNLTHPTGAAILKRMVKVSDAVVENYSPRVMKQFGLDWEVLREINPGLVMVSMPGFGSTGPWKDYVSYAATMECMGGIAGLTGYEGGGPSLQGASIGDPLSGLNGAIAVLMALLYRDRTKKGLHIDLAQMEAITCLTGDAIMDYTMNGRVQARKGNTDLAKAPYGCYRCQGEDNWVVIGVSTDEEWESLCRVMGDPDWTIEARFADSLSRCQHHAALDELLEHWTGERDHIDVMNLLQEAGVPAGAVLNCLEIPQDRHLVAREYFQEVERAYVGRHPYPTMGIKLSKSDVRIRMPAPCLGEHNEYILGKVLGLSQAEIAELERQQIIGKDPLPDGAVT